MRKEAPVPATLTVVLMCSGVFLPWITNCFFFTFKRSVQKWHNLHIAQSNLHLKIKNTTGQRYRSISCQPPPLHWDIGLIVHSRIPTVNWPGRMADHRKHCAARHHTTPATLCFGPFGTTCHHWLPPNCFIRGLLSSGCDCFRFYVLLLPRSHPGIFNILHAEYSTFLCITPNSGNW